MNIRLQSSYTASFNLLVVVIYEYFSQCNSVTIPVLTASSNRTCQLGLYLVAAITVRVVWQVSSHLLSLNKMFSSVWYNNLLFLNSICGTPLLDTFPSLGESYSLTEFVCFSKFPQTSRMPPHPPPSLCWMPMKWHTGIRLVLAWVTFLGWGSLGDRTSKI
jgi:hypothetical protein